MSLGQKKSLCEQTQHDPRTNRKAWRTRTKIPARVGDVNEVTDVSQMRSQKSRKK